jgi:hypothetical protein
MELREADRFRRVTRAWMAASLVLFVVLSVPGILMRFVQSNLSVGLAPRFYPMMTLHGVGMVGLWFVSGMAGVVHLSCRYVRPSLAASWIAFGATAGVLLLAAAAPREFRSRLVFPVSASGPLLRRVARLVRVGILPLPGIMAPPGWSGASTRCGPSRGATRWERLWRHSPSGERARRRVPPLVLITTRARGPAGSLSPRS